MNIFNVTFDMSSIFVTCLVLKLWLP
jgi:hypothetical protein